MNFFSKHDGQRTRPIYVPNAHRSAQCALMIGFRWTALFDFLRLGKCLCGEVRQYLGDLLVGRLARKSETSLRLLPQALRFCCHHRNLGERALKARNVT
jgi:hypothetical protein